MRRRRGRHAPSRSTRSINRARVEPPDICEMESGEDDSDEEEPAAAAAAAPQRCDGAPAHASPCARRVVCDRCGKCDKHCPSWKHSGYECREIEEEAAQPGQRRRRARPSTEAATVDAAAAAAAAAAAEAAAAAVVNQPPAAPAAAHRQLRDEHAAPSDVTAAYGFKKSFGTNSYNSTGEKVSAAKAEKAEGRQRKFLNDCALPLAEMLHRRGAEPPTELLQRWHEEEVGNVEAPLHENAVKMVDTLSARSEGAIAVGALLCSVAPGNAVKGTRAGVCRNVKAGRKLYKKIIEKKKVEAPEKLTRQKNPQPVMNNLVAFVFLR